MTNRRGLDNSPDFSRDYFVNPINCEQAFFVVGGGGGGGGFFLSSTSKKKRPLGRSLFGNKHTPSEALFLQFSGQGIGKFETI